MNWKGWFLVAVLAAGPANSAQRWAIENNSLGVALDSDGSLSMEQKAVQTKWSSETAPGASVSDVFVSPDRCSLRVILRASLVPEILEMLAAPGSPASLAPGIGS